MAIEIKLTPRRIERFFFIVLLVFFMSTTVFYSYKAYNNPTTTANVVAESEENLTRDAESIQEEAEKVEETEAETEEKAEEVEEQTEEETQEVEDELSGEFDVEIAPLRYEIQESGEWEKAVIDNVAFIFDNQLSKDLRLKIDVFAFDSSSSDAHRTYPKDTIQTALIPSGSSVTKVYDVENLNLYNFDLAKTIKFDFYDSEGELLVTKAKTLDIEE